jgi:hypothetical protein
MIIVSLPNCSATRYRSNEQNLLNGRINMKIGNFAFWSLTLLSTLPAHLATAQSVTNDMTCQQAIAEYERNGRVYVRQRSGSVLPIYVGVPLSQKNRLLCDFDQFKMYYTVPTKDKRRCGISWRCQN